jgi:hypothetical protein
MQNLIISIFQKCWKIFEFFGFIEEIKAGAHMPRVAEPKLFLTKSDRAPVPKNPGAA